jgi:hypothetical protein
MADVRWRYATPADIQTFHGGPVSQTMRAVVVEADGEPVVMVGLVNGGGAQYFFSEERADAASHRRRLATLRALKRVMEWVSASAVPVFSVSDNDALMGRLGFKKLEQGVYIWN